MGSTISVIQTKKLKRKFPLSIRCVNFPVPFFQGTLNSFFFTRHETKLIKCLLFLGNLKEGFLFIR